MTFKNLQFWSPLKKESPRPQDYQPLTHGIRRRVAVALLVGAAFAVAPINIPNASAILLSGASITVPGSQITTVTLANNSGSSETPQWSRIFGLGFPDSDTTGCPLIGGLPSYPQFKSGSTVISYSMSLYPTYYASGRLCHATFVLLLGGNVTVSGSGASAINVYQTNTTSLPSASSRALSDFSTANIQHFVTGLDNLSGNYSATLNDGVSSAFSDNYTWLDGPAGKMWRIRARYKQAGTAHGNLEAYIYCMSMQDSSGNFGGTQHLWCLATPFVDDNSLTDFLSFSAMTLQTGATVIRDNVTSGRSNTQVFTWSGAGTSWNAASNILEQGQLCRVSNSGGALPTGLSAGTSYWLNHSGDATYSPPYSNFQLSSLFSLSGTFITPSDGGSGTHTLTTYPFINTYSRLYMASTTGMWDYVQGGGSTAGVSTYVMTNLRVTHDNVYWRKTKLIASYDFTPTITSPSSNPFYINTAAGLDNTPTPTSPVDRVGVLPQPAAAYIYTMAQSDEINMRAIGLANGQPMNALRVLANGATCMAWNKGTNFSGTPYRGMGSTLYYNKTFSTASTMNVFSPVGQPASVRPITGQSTGNTSHMSSFHYAPYLFTGEPQYLDMGIENASISAAGLGTGSTTPCVSNVTGTHFGPLGLSSDSTVGVSTVTAPNGTTYSRILNFQTQTRSGGWCLRSLGDFAAITPQNHPEADYKTYLSNMMDDNLAFHASLCAAEDAVNPFAATIGFTNTFPLNAGFQVGWQNSYQCDAWSMYYGRTGNANALTLMNRFTTMVAWMVNNFGPAVLGLPEQKITESTNLNAGPIITAKSGFGSTIQSSLTWTSVTPASQLQIDVTRSIYHMTVGDILIWTDANVPSENNVIPIPAAVTAFVPYYVVSVSTVGSTDTIQISATPGGSAIPMTDDSTFAHTVFWQPANPTAILTATNNTSFPTQIGRACYLAKSRGATLDAAAEAIIDANIAAATTGNFATKPQWCFGKVA